MRNLENLPAFTAKFEKYKANSRKCRISASGVGFIQTIILRIIENFVICNYTPRY